MSTKKPKRNRLAQKLRERGIDPDSVTPKDSAEAKRELDRHMLELDKAIYPKDTKAQRADRLRGVRQTLRRIVR